MAAADDVNLGDGLMQAVLDPGQDLLQGHLIGPFLSGFSPKRAEFAAIDADVGIIEVLVVNVKGFAAMQPLPDDVRQKAHPQEVFAVKERQAVMRIKPFPLKHLLMDRNERLV
jgi:hypothetical protein